MALGSKTVGSQKCNIVSKDEGYPWKLPSRRGFDRGLIKKSSSWKGMEKCGSYRQVWKVTLSEAAGSLGNTEHRRMRIVLPRGQTGLNSRVQTLPWSRGGSGQEGLLPEEGGLLILSLLYKVEGKIKAWKWRMTLILHKKYKMKN